MIRVNVLYIITLCFSLLHGFEQGRNGDIIINDKQLPQAQFSWNVDGLRVKDTQLFDMLARYFGVPRMLSEEELKINIDLFHRPQGSLFFSIEGLSSNRLIKSNYRAFSTTPIVDLIPSEQPNNPFSVIGSILTGVEPSIHGVINQRWPSLSIGNYYEVGNFFDSLVQLRSTGTFVSGSSSREAALSLSPHILLQKSFAGMFWDSKKGIYTSISSSTTPYSISRENFALLLKQLGVVMKLRFSYSIEDSYISISKDEAEPIVFDLSDPDDETLFAEVLFVLNMASNQVDFFSFHFQSLSNLYAKYGNSEEYDIAVAMVDAVIAHITEVYGEKATYIRTILYFADNYRSQEVETPIDSVVKEYVVVPTGFMPFSSIVSFLPHIYLTKNGKYHKPTICEELRKALANSNVDVLCDDGYQNKRAIAQNGSVPVPVPVPAPSGGGDQPASQAEVELVHISLWIVIALICSLVQSCYILAVVDGSNEPEFKARTFDLSGRRSQTQRVK